MATAFKRLLVGSPKRTEQAVINGFENARQMVPVAARLGVTILAGTDMYPPGSIWREVAALQASGLEPALALAAASTAARAFLGEPALVEGAPADLVLYERDPRNDPEFLTQPSLVMFRGQLIATASFDHTVKLWDPASGGELATLEGHTEGVNCLAFSPNGRQIAFFRRRLRTGSEMLRDIRTRAEQSFFFAAP